MKKRKNNKQKVHYDYMKFKKNGDTNHFLTIINLIKINHKSMMRNLNYLSLLKIEGMIKQTLIGWVKAMKRIFGETITRYFIMIGSMLFTMGICLIIFFIAGLGNFRDEVYIRLLFALTNSIIYVTVSRPYINLLEISLGLVPTHYKLSPK